MVVNNPYKQYKKTQVDSADQGQLIVMLYDGAIRAINKAIDLMSEKPLPPDNIEKIHVSIVKAQDIIMELTGSLNMDVGEIAERLLNIYMYINQKLLSANVNKDIAPLKEIKEYLVELRDAWGEAAKKSSSSKDNQQNSGGINIAT